MLWLYVMALGIVAGIAPDAGLSSKVDYLSRTAFSFIVASWLVADARKRREPLCYDYDSFAFFAWPVVLPVYLFRTRAGARFLHCSVLRASGWLRCLRRWWYS